MRTALLAVFLLLGACRDNKPPTPTAEQSDQLNEADSMLDNLANEEGPEQSPGPSNSSQ